MGLVNRGWPLEEHVPTVVDYLNDAGILTVHAGLQHERSSPSENRYAIELAADGDNEARFAENAVARAVDFLSTRRSSSDPFYLNVGTVEVHCSLWQDLTGPRKDTYGSAAVDDAAIPPHMPDTPELRREMGRFHACIRYTDAAIAELLEAVDRFGLTESTLVIYTTDHGISAHRAKGTLYDSGTEIALIASQPGTLASGTLFDGLIGNVDIAPTILDAAGVPVPVGLDGRSFWPALVGAEYEPHEMLFTERNFHAGQYDPMRAIRTGSFHYIRNFDPAALGTWLPSDQPEMGSDYQQWFTEMWPQFPSPRAPEELYDLSKDPDEFVNVASDPAYSHDREQLSALLYSQMRQLEDPLLNGPIVHRTEQAAHRTADDTAIESMELKGGGDSIDHSGSRPIGSRGNANST